MMKNMNQLMKQAKKMQEEMMKAQEALAEKTVEGTAGGGVVTVVVNGHKLVQSVTIQPEAVDPEDVEMLQDLILTAVNDAMKKADELVASEMSKYTRGLQLPGLF
jgi:DNA-binding YbaB/EbfC family protein